MSGQIAALLMSVMSFKAVVSLVSNLVNPYELKSVIYHRFISDLIRHELTV